MKRLSLFFTKLPLKWYLVGIAVLATVLRLISLTKASIWHDEGYSAMIIQFPIGEIIGHSIRDFHPPLYALTLHCWSLIFGSSELALRSLSLVCGVATVIVIYFIMKRLHFSEQIARLAILFAAFAPFLIRYSQEARMYGMAALLVCLATLVLLIALDKGASAKSKKYRYCWWMVYGLIMAAALYTHYYAGFIVFVHVGYAWHRSGGLLKLLQYKEWWVGNLLAAGLFAVWIPFAIAQFSRVQKGYWIPPVDAETLPNTFMQFIAFSSNRLNPSLEVLAFVALACATTVCLIRTKRTLQPSLLFVVAWLMVPLFIALTVSIVKQPVYYDRYFIYSAAAFSCLLAILILSSRARRNLKITMISLVLLVSSMGIAGVYIGASHKMKDVGSYVSSNYQPGDFLISGELYTYFDFSYYNKTDAELHLLSADPLIKTGESSLIYDRQKSIVVPELAAISNADSKRVWLVGKTGEHDYDTTLVPKNWKLVTHVQAGDSSVRLYDLPD